MSRKFCGSCDSYTDKLTEWGMCESCTFLFLTKKIETLNDELLRLIQLRSQLHRNNPGVGAFTQTEGRHFQDIAAGQKEKNSDTNSSPRTPEENRSR